MTGRYAPPMSAVTPPINATDGSLAGHTAGDPLTNCQALVLSHLRRIAQRHRIGRHRRFLNLRSVFSDLGFGLKLDVFRRLRNTLIGRTGRVTGYTTRFNNRPHLSETNLPGQTFFFTTGKDFYGFK